MLIPDWLARREALSPERVALIDQAAAGPRAGGDQARGGREITYRAWNRIVNRSARFLLSTVSLRKGERVAVLSKNSTEYLDVLFACQKTGAILSALNWRLTVHELTAIVADAAPAALVYGPGFESAVAAIAASPAARSIRRFIAIGEPAGEGHLSFAAREAMSAEPPPPVELRDDDPWVLCSTGGSTGLPKAAILTHGNILWNAVNTVVSWGLRPDEGELLAQLATNPDAALLKLVRTRRKLLANAWLTATGHTRPGVPAGLPLAEANAQAAALAEKIRALK